jgi:RND family efflux transporter MFP subunit
MTSIDRLECRWMLALAGVGVGSLWIGGLAAQQRPASPVRYTLVREHLVQGTVRLPGSVESPRLSVVAGSVNGLVVEFPVREGEAVQKGQLLARLRTKNLKLRLQVSEAELREAEARTKLAEKNLERSKELFDSKVFSQQELDSSFYEFNAWQGRIENLRAEIERIRYDIERCTIIAPFDGTVVAKPTEVGQSLAVADPVVDLMSTNDLEVSVDVPETYLSTLRIVRRVAVEFEALGVPRTTGTVSRIIPRADPQARTFPVKLAFTNKHGRVLAGMLAQVSFPGGQSVRATIVPKDAVVTQGPRKSVWVMDEGGTVQPVAVEVGAGAEAWTEVRGALRPGQRVVTRGNERLRPGQQVSGTSIEYKLP